VLARTAPGGTVVAIGGSSDEPTTFDALTFIRRGSVTFYGMQLFDEMERQGLGSVDLARLLGLVATGRLDPQIAVKGSWREMGTLLARLEDREVPGKAVALVD
jgi:NADPH2:quinone reductase